MRLAGIDGCKAGWVAVVVESDRPDTAQLAYSSNLTDLISGEAIDFALVDMPIGFVDGPFERDVEKAMRAFLPGKASSVFNTPCRMALGEPTQFDASFVNEQALGKRLSKQSVALFPKMREVDAAVRQLGQTRLREGHPEVSFAALYGRPVLSKKRDQVGQKERSELLQAADFPTKALLSARLSKCGIDDVLDAAVLAWSAIRYSKNKHIIIPPVPSRDSVGLEMSVIA